MTTRTRVAYTYEESAPGVPLWGPNAVTTDLPTDATSISIENLISGKRYYIKTWKEDEFGNKSREVLRTINTPPPTKLQPLTFSANGVLDSGSPMYAFVKVPSNVQLVSECKITLAFRQFFAHATAATTTGTLTSDSGGGSTSGASSASSSSATGVGHVHSFATDGGAGAGGASRLYGPTGVGPGFYINTTAAGNIETGPETTSLSHSHPIPHTHSTPAHQHTVPGHSHALTYGTFEEAYPTSHSVTVKVYQRVASAWTLVYTSPALTGDLEDLDLAAVITGPGDWRVQAQSDAAQPNGGRLGLDLFGSLTVTMV